MLELKQDRPNHSLLVSRFDRSPQACALKMYSYSKLLEVCFSLSRTALFYLGVIIH